MRDAAVEVGLQAIGFGLVLFVGLILTQAWLDWMWRR